MVSLKQEAISAINKMPDSVGIDDIMYRLYVIDKVKKGKESAQNDKSLTFEQLEREMESW